MSKQATVWTVVIVVVLIILGLVFWGGKDEVEVPAPRANTDEVSDEIIIENEIIINEQKAGTRTAIASFAFLQQDGYVVVHARDANGRPGAVLGGSALLPAGQSITVAIPLSAALVDGKSYIAMLHIDDGDGILSETLDRVAQDGDGDEVLVEFTVSKDAQ